MSNANYSDVRSNKKLAPQGAEGRAQVRKIGRTYKTGGFDKIANKAAKEYGSSAVGKRVAGSIFQKMVRGK